MSRAFCSPTLKLDIAGSCRDFLRISDSLQRIHPRRAPRAGVTTAVPNLNQHCEPGPKQCVAGYAFRRRLKNANDQDRWLQAWLRGDGSCEAAGDRQQRWQSESRRRTQGEYRPLSFELRVRRTLIPPPRPARVLLKFGQRARGHKR